MLFLAATRHKNMQKLVRRKRRANEKMRGGNTTPTRTSVVVHIRKSPKKPDNTTSCTTTIAAAPPSKWPLCNTILQQLARLSVTYNFTPHYYPDHLLSIAILPRALYFFMNCLKWPRRPHSLRARTLCSTKYNVERVQFARQEHTDYQYNGDDHQFFQTHGKDVFVLACCTGAWIVTLLGNNDADGDVRFWILDGETRTKVEGPFLMSIFLQTCQFTDLDEEEEEECIVRFSCFAEYSQETSKFSWFA